MLGVVRFILTPTLNVTNICCTTFLQPPCRSQSNYPSLACPQEGWMPYFSGMNLLQIQLTACTLSTYAPSMGVRCVGSEAVWFVGLSSLRDFLSMCWREPHARRWSSPWGMLLWWCYYCLLSLCPWERRDVLCRHHHEWEQLARVCNQGLYLCCYPWKWDVMCDDSDVHYFIGFPMLWCVVVTMMIWYDFCFVHTFTSYFPSATYSRSTSIHRVERHKKKKKITLFVVPHNIHIITFFILW